MSILAQHTEEMVEKAGSDGGKTGQRSVWQLAVTREDGHLHYPAHGQAQTRAEEVPGHGYCVHLLQ